MPRNYLVLLLLLTLAIAACGAREAPSADEVATIVAATLQAAETAALPPAPTPEAPSTGSVSGALGYPSEGIPPLDVVAFSDDGVNWVMLQTAQNQTSYQIDDLPAGNYTVVAYVSGSHHGGGYTAAVPCGLSVDCSDHSLITVSVAGGQVADGIDLTDWYASENAFPPNPASAQGVGSIAGSLSYPSNFIPAMNVVAFSLEDNAWSYVVTQQNQSSYQIDGLPSGQYYVVAYPVGDTEGAGYSAAVPCGLSVNCSDHSLLPVTVTNDDVTEGIDPGDWYAGPGAFPANPVP